MFKNLFSFNGRIRRLEYGLSYAAYWVCYYFIVVAIDDNGPISSFAMLISIPVLWIMFAQGAKRCHDKNKNGWFQFIPFYVFVLLFSEGEHGENEYGPNPKGIGNKYDIDEIGKMEE